MLPTLEARCTAGRQGTNGGPDVGETFELGSVFRALAQPLVKPRFHFRRAVRPVQTGDPGRRLGPRGKLLVQGSLLAIQSLKKNAARATCFSTMLTLISNCSAIWR